MKSKRFYSNGKLLLSGEYVVLDGALSLAIPTCFGQSMHIEPINLPHISWTSIDNNGNNWFEEILPIKLDNNSQVPQNSVSKRLNQILKVAKQLNPDFLNSETGFKITTHLDFPRNWGLGTSSTLINNMAQWAQIDAYQLLENTFGGSGYDIACAQHNQPITYQLQHNKPIVNEIVFKPSFKNQLYFVYLNKKQNSRDAIINYNANKGNLHAIIKEINDITTKLITCKKIEDFDDLITNHEALISKLIKQQPIKSTRFQDFQGSIKSLGAWGGDFILVTAKENPKPYFKNKGFETIIPYNKMVL